MNLSDIKLLVDAREDDSASSWIAARPYGEVLEGAREDCPSGYHIMTLAEYMVLWQGTVQEMGSRACNEADVWVRFQSDRNESDPISYVRHPFLSTVLVDTFLTDWAELPLGEYACDVVIGGEAKDRVIVPPTGKIYAVSRFGLPSRTGGRRIADSEAEAFEHRWWAFSSDRVRSHAGAVNPSFKMALFGNGGTVGCFCELIKAHYSLDEAGGFYRILALPNK